jgi:hypothetical protein
MGKTRRIRGGAKENDNLRKRIHTRGAINRLDKLQSTFILNQHSKKEIKNLNEAIRGRAESEEKRVAESKYKKANTRKRVGEKRKARKIGEVTRTAFNAKPKREPLSGMRDFLFW